MAWELASTEWPMSVDRQVTVSNPRAAITRTPVNSIPSAAASPVEIIEDAVGCREMEQMPAGEIGFHRDTARGPPVREAWCRFALIRLPLAI